jgi:hypothetical protein
MAIPAGSSTPQIPRILSSHNSSFAALQCNDLGGLPDRPPPAQTSPLRCDVIFPERLRQATLSSAAS